MSNPTKAVIGTVSVATVLALLVVFQLAFAA